MDTASVLLAVAALGFQWGYRADADGTIEYAIQLTPAEAEHLATSPGAEIVSYIPAEAQPIGRVRVVIGEAPLPRGDQISETQLRVARTRERDKDAAGDLVAVAPDTAARGTAAREGLHRGGPDGSPAAGRTDLPASGRAAETAATPGDVENDVRPRDRDNLREPVHTVGSPEAASNAVPPFNGEEADTAGTAADSPSDRPDRGTNEATSTGDASHRPWLPLVATAAVAVGFLAGNVFQWRTYVSLRRRYLQLLRKSG